MVSKPPASSTWKLLTISTSSGRITAAATMMLTTTVATDSWVTRLRQRVAAGARSAVSVNDCVLIAPRYWNFACHASRVSLNFLPAATQSFMPSSFTLLRSNT